MLHGGRRGRRLPERRNFIGFSPYFERRSSEPPWRDYRHLVPADVDKYFLFLVMGEAIIRACDPYYSGPQSDSSSSAAWEKASISAATSTRS